MLAKWKKKRERKRITLSFCFVCLQLAVMSGHFELGEIIKNHKDSDVGKLSCQTFSSDEAIEYLFSTQHLPFFLPLRSPFFLNFLISSSISSCHIKPHSPSSPLNPPFKSRLTPLSSVPFLESPKYVPKRKESAHTLPLPSLHSHHLLRANSDNTMTQSDPLAMPNKAATNPNPGQVLKTIWWMVIYWSLWY